MQDLLGVSRTFLEASRRELEAGLTENNHLKVRQAAEKARKAIVQATDCAMYARGVTPPAGRDVHRERRGFFERIGRSDLSEKYTYFAERLHGDVFYGGVDVPPDAMRRYLDEVRDFIEQVSRL